MRASSPRPGSIPGAPWLGVCPDCGGNRIFTAKRCKRCSGRAQTARSIADTAVTDRQILAMKERGMTHRAIAAELGRSPEYVPTMIARAVRRERLRG